MTIENKFSLWEEVYIFESPWVISRISIDLSWLIEYLVYVPWKDEHKWYDDWQISTDITKIWFKW